MGSKKKESHVEPEEKLIGEEQEVESTEDTKLDIQFEETPESQKEPAKNKKVEDLKKEEAAKAYKKVDKSTKTKSKKDIKVDQDLSMEEAQEEEKKTPPKNSEELIKEMNDRYLRLQAEFMNYKKRVEKESLELASYLKAEIIKDFLPVFDDFKHMVENVEKDHDNVNSVLEGIHMIFNKHMQFIEKFGVKRMDCLHKEFNPDYHEALITQPVEEKKKDNMIVQIYQDGYELNDRVVRPAKVIVGKYEEKKADA